GDGRDMIDFDEPSHMDEPSRDTGGARTSLADEMDDFLSDDVSSGGDFSPRDAGKNDSIFDMADSADSSLARGNYSAALELYQKIASLNKTSNPEEREVTETAYFNAGRC